MLENGYVIIEGNIGVGKSTFAGHLADALRARGLKATALYEPDETNNPFLPLYYADPKKHAYEMQMHLLHKRYAVTQYAQWGAMSGQGWFILDRSFYGDLCFAAVQMRDGYFTPEQIESYHAAHRNMELHLGMPTAAIFLHADAEQCRARIGKRMSEKVGRECESGIEIKYLQDLQSEIDRLEGYMTGRTRVFSSLWQSCTPEQLAQKAGEFASRLVDGVSCVPSYFCPWGADFAALIDRGTL